MTAYDLYSLATCLIRPAALIVSLIAFLAVGLVMISLLWHADWRVRPSLMALLVMGCSSALGYLFFWIYLVSPLCGKFATLLLVASVFAYFIRAPSRMKVLALLRFPDLWIPLALTLSVGLFLTTITYVGREGQGACTPGDIYLVGRLMMTGGSPDYLIQRYWVDGLSSGSPPWNFVLDPLVSRSTVADRPPLLAGIVLMFNSLVPEKIRFAYFMAMTSAASLVWIPAIWSLSRAASLTLVRTSVLISMLAFVYYFWFSTIFSWPKMLSGGLFIGAFLLLYLDRESEAEPLSIKSIILGAGFAGLSYVSHFSVSVLLLGMALLLLMAKRWFGVRRTIAAALVFLAIATPYVVLRSAHEGPSMLTRYVLTGGEFNAMTTLDAVRSVYSAMTWQEIIQNRLDSIKGNLFYSFCWFSPCDGQTFKQSRDMESISIGPSMKLFNLGWLILVPLLWIGGVKFGLSPHWNRIRVVSRDCLLVAFSGFLIFLIVSFSNVNNSATSAFMLLFMAATGVVLFSLPLKIVGLFSLLVATNFIWFTSQVFGEDDLILFHPLLALTFLSAISLIAIIMVSARIDHVDSLALNKELS